MHPRRLAADPMSTLGKHLLVLPTAVATVMSSFTVATVRADTANCPDVEVVFARGTGELPGLGRVGQVFADYLAAQSGGRSIAAYGVNYPASYNFFTTADGANDAAAHLTEMVERCPSTELVLGGFSQGAAAVSMLAGVPPLGNTVGDLGSSPPLSPAIAERVVAIAVFGNPSARFGAPLSDNGQFAGRTVDICAVGDPICSVTGNDRVAHSVYAEPDYAGVAAAHVVGLL